MDLQADIDALLRHSHPTPFGLQKWQHARIEALQRLVAMTSIQFFLFELKDYVEGNEELAVAAEKLVTLLSKQLKIVKKHKSDWRRLSPRPSRCRKPKSKRLLPRSSKRWTRIGSG